MDNACFSEGVQSEAFFFSIPTPILVLDEQLHVYEANLAARRFFHKGAGFRLDRPCGDTIGCFYKFDSGQKCGETSRCKDCAIRNAVAHVLHETSVVRKRSSMYVQRDLHAEEMNYLLTAWPVSVGGKTLAMVMFEDLTDLFQLGQILPMCAACKKIKTVEDKWETVEKYISRNLGSDTSHGICPDCRKKLYPHIE